MRELAKRQNVYCKLSGMVTEADPQWTPQILQPYIDVVLAAFGPRRLMYGSDWPVMLLAERLRALVPHGAGPRSRSCRRRSRIASWAGRRRKLTGCEWRFYFVP